MKKLLSFCLALSLCLGLLPASASALGFAEDVAEDHWAYAEIELLLSEGVLMTDLDFNFNPDTPISRERFVLALWRAHGSPEVELPEEFRFSDLSADMLSGQVEAIEWAYQSGVTDGIGETRFGVGELLTREQAMTFLGRLFLLREGEELPETIKSINEFADAGDLSEWAQEPMQLMVDLGVIKGDTQNRLNPGANLSNAETAVIVLRSEYKGLGDDFSDDDFTALEGWWLFSAYEGGELAHGMRSYITPEGKWITFGISAGAENLLLGRGYLTQSEAAGLYDIYEYGSDTALQAQLLEGDMLRWDGYVMSRD